MRYELRTKDTVAAEKCGVPAFHRIHRVGVVVASFVASTKLLYVEPG